VAHISLTRKFGFYLSSLNSVTIANVIIELSGVLFMSFEWRFRSLEIAIATYLCLKFVSRSYNYLKGDPSKCMTLRLNVNISTQTVSFLIFMRV